MSGCRTHLRGPAPPPPLLGLAFGGSAPAPQHLVLAFGGSDPPPACQFRVWGVWAPHPGSEVGPLLGGGVAGEDPPTPPEQFAARRKPNDG
eukprot:1187546-Prorocentrum_minimum.AAC.1